MNAFTEDKLNILFQYDTDGCLRLSEGHSVEYKESFNIANRSGIIKIMSALANHKGGYIISGVRDSDRKLKGLNSIMLESFENLDGEQFRGSVLSAVSPNITYERYIHMLDGMSFGLIYVHEELNKPCIIKRNEGDLVYGDIYSRSNDSVRKMEYAELSAIIESKRQKEQEKWMKFLERIAKIGLDNVLIIDRDNGNIINNSGEDIISLSESVISGLNLVHEGTFVDNDGNPTLRLIGDIKPISEIQIGEIDLTSDPASVFNSNEIFKYNLGQIKRKIDNDNIKTSDNILTKDFKWSWNRVLFYVENENLKQNQNYSLSSADGDGNISTKYSVMLFNDFKQFVETHTKDELISYRKRKQEVTNE